VPSRCIGGRTPNFDYDPDIKTLKVTRIGDIRWVSYYLVYLSAALKGSISESSSRLTEFGEYIIEKNF